MNGFSPQQKHAVNEAGFGSLLKFKDLEIRRDLCKDIAKSFDIDTEEFIINGKRIKLSMKDVHHILGPPAQGDGIKEPPRKHVP